MTAANKMPIISVVDAEIVWHVQTDPTLDTPFTGAWMDKPVSELTLGTVIVHPDDGTLERISAAINAEIATYKQVHRSQQEATAEPGAKARNLSALRMPKVAVPDIAAAKYSGDPRAERAWRYAQGIAELVREWGDIESTRRRRSGLNEVFGTEIRALPGLPA
ncbi:hypothetical protein [Corynebacterium caspium]|uniref:hypothetical protein n=1 Tax=Corynebacterium caspium TaxID=234828 RepID=UPI00037C8133|nr:hypothetical protein [Corynebacterium caspium]WKD58513.1 hypothetical protein CCASP_00385 [Corynebacterium caspium DSM 44850]